MKFNLIGSTSHLNISSGNAVHYIKRLDIPDLTVQALQQYVESMQFGSVLCNKA